MSDDDLRLPSNEEIDIENEARRARVLAKLLPFWRRDTRAFGKHGPRSATAIRFLIVAVVAALGVIAWAVLYVNSAVNQVHEAQKDGHASRLHDQSVLQGEIRTLRKLVADNRAANRDLACSVVNYVNKSGAPQTPSTKRFLHFLATRYDCVDYKPGPSPFTPSTTPTRSAASSPANARAPSTSVGAIGPAPSTAHPAPTTSRAPRPTATSRPAPRPSTTTRSTPRPTPSTSTSSASVLCTLTKSLLGICVLP